MGVLASPPRSPVLLRAIMQVISAVQRRWYGDFPTGSLFVTGPLRLGNALAEISLPNETVKGPNRSLAYHAHGQLVAMLYPWWQCRDIFEQEQVTHKLIKNCRQCNDYDRLYFNRVAYCDDAVDTQTYFGFYDPCDDVDNWGVGFAANVSS